MFWIPTHSVSSALMLCTLAGAAGARAQSGTLDLHPISGSVTRAGVFDFDNKRWLSSTQAIGARASTLTVYDNTCTWAGGGFYTSTGNCEDLITDGRIPGGAGGSNPLGSTPDNRINFFEFGYCTTFATGTVDIKIGFYDSLGGPCVGAVSPTPPSLASQAAGWFDFGAAAGFPLPGASIPGQVTCHVVGIVSNSGFCLLSDGDGVFDAFPSLDNFSWSFQMDNSLSVGVPGSGVIVAGDPSQSVRGGCTYDLPCGLPPFGPDCGHGLDVTDNYWSNVDAATPNCVGAPAGGSGCYWFGGYPGNPFASFYMRMGSAGSCAGCTGAPSTYCTAGVSTGGCSPTLSLSGTPSLSQNAPPALITASNVQAARNGLVFFGLNSDSTVFSPGSSSFLCVKAPLVKGTLRSASPLGTSGCVGVLSENLNGVLAANGCVFFGQQIFAGTKVFAQCWHRDPLAPGTGTLSNGIEVSICP